MTHQNTFWRNLISAKKKGQSPQIDTNRNWRIIVNVISVFVGDIVIVVGDLTFDLKVVKVR